MLAFSFKAFSVEADVAKGLLEFKPDSDNPEDDNKEMEAEEKQKEELVQDNDDDDFSPIDEDYTSSYDKAIGPREMLSISMSGIARPLKSRILQVITTLSRRPGINDSELSTSKGGGGQNRGDGIDDDEYNIGDDEFGEESLRLRSKIANLYDICGLLLFYVSVMGKCIDKLQNSPLDKKTNYQRRVEDEITDTIKHNALVASLIECFVEGTVAYEATVRVYGAMLDQWSIMTGESESALIHSMIVRIADVRINSPGYSSEVSVDDFLPKTHNFASENIMTASSCRTILSIEWITETLIESCLTSKCKHIDDILFLKQSLEASKQAGLSIVSYEKLNQEIMNKESALINELVLQESTHVLELCSLGSISSVYLSYQEEKKNNPNNNKLMISYPGLSQSIVETAIKEFYMSLYSPPLPTLESNIKDPMTRRIVRTKISEYVSELYTAIYASILDNGGGYKDANRFLEYPPEQVKTLFSA